MSDLAIQVHSLGKRYRLGERSGYGSLRDSLGESVSRPLRSLRASIRGEQPSPRSRDHIWALRDVSFDVRQGEVLGIVGKNGAGKSTLLKILSRIIRPSEGQARLRGRVGSLLEVGTGFHPELTGQENIYLSGAILGMSRREVRERFDQIVAFSEVEEYIETPVKRYSSGMYARLAFAVAAHLDPDILIVDEVLAVGDAQFQRKCLGKLNTLSQNGRTVLFVSHNMGAIQRLCHRALLLEEGRLVRSDSSAGIVSYYLTESLDQARPDQWIDTAGIARQGSGRVRVTALRYICGDGADPAALLLPGGRLSITLNLVSDAPRQVGSVAVTIYDNLGAKLINLDTMALGQMIRVDEQGVRVTFEVEHLNLNPGQYTLGWWISQPSVRHEILDFAESALRLEVSEPLVRGFGARPDSDGVVVCPFRISTVPDAHFIA